MTFMAMNDPVCMNQYNIIEQHTFEIVNKFIYLGTLRNNENNIRRGN